MKLAEALTLRADLQKRIAQLRTRLNANSKVQEGDTPAEEPKELLEELEKDICEYEELIRRINYTNCNVKADGMTLTDMIAKRDVMALKLSVLRDFLAQASEKVNRYSNNEIKIVSTVNVREMQKQIDKNSKELRELDTKIQGINWTSDLL